MEFSFRAIMKNFFFELCAESMEAARAAESGGADRIELCSQLCDGGVTPALALTMAAVDALSIPVYVLIRPRAGSFVYSQEEFGQMRRQIAQAKQAGAAGVAIGLLLRDGRIDVERSKELVSLSRPLGITFHRAFDEAVNFGEALEAVIQTGADCLLTSGGAPDVGAGAASIARLQRQADGRIHIMAGGGLTLSNLVEVVRRTGVSYLHGSLTSRDLNNDEDGMKLEIEDRRMGMARDLEADVRESIRLFRHEVMTRQSLARSEG
jgi:copper homeostasis protein